MNEIVKNLPKVEQLHDRGAANGLHETIYHHYPKFKKVHPLS